VALISSDWFAVILSNLSTGELLRFTRVNRAYWTLVLRGRHAPRLWQTVDLRRYHLTDRQFVRLMHHVSGFMRTLHLVAQGPHEESARVREDDRFVSERRHPAVQWLLDNAGAVRDLKALSVMSELDWDAIQLLLMRGVTTINCGNPGVPPEVPPAVHIRAAPTVMVAGVHAQQTVLEERVLVHFNGLRADVEADEWTPVATCSAAGRIGQQCDEVPSFPWRRNYCQWCLQAHCRHCRRVWLRTYNVKQCDEPSSQAVVKLWLCRSCEQQFFGRPRSFHESGKWLDAPLLLLRP